MPSPSTRSGRQSKQTKSSANSTSESFPFLRSCSVAISTRQNLQKQTISSRELPDRSPPPEIRPFGGLVRDEGGIEVHERLGLGRVVSRDLRRARPDEITDDRGGERSSVDGGKVGRDRSGREVADTGERGTCSVVEASRRPDTVKGPGSSVTEGDGRRDEKTGSNVEHSPNG